MKSELLVIAEQHAAVNTFSSLVLTARHTKGVGNARSTMFIQGPKAGSMTRVKS